MTSVGALIASDTAAVIAPSTGNRRGAQMASNASAAGSTGTVHKAESQIAARSGVGSGHVAGAQPQNVPGCRESRKLGAAAARMARRRNID